MRKMTFAEAGKLGFIKSAKTRSEQYLKRQEDYKLNPNFCSYCKKELSYKNRKNKFCNKSCAASFNNCGKIKNCNYGKSKYSLKKCTNCNNISKNVKFCSSVCQHEFKWKNLKLTIEETGKFFGNRTAKRYLQEKYGNICSICGRDAVWEDKPLVLVLDHINGNSSDCSITNLRLICPNCDSQTSTFKGKNFGNGRYQRRIRYANKQSY